MNAGSSWIKLEADAGLMAGKQGSDLVVMIWGRASWWWPTGRGCSMPGSCFRKLLPPRSRKARGGGRGEEVVVGAIESSFFFNECLNHHHED